MDPYYSPTPPGSSARGFLLAIAGLVGAAAGSVGLVAAYMAYGGPATPASEPKPAPVPVADPLAPRLVQPQGASPNGGMVSAQRAANGHFYFNAAVNGTIVRTMFDTGASTVVLRAEDAVAAGIPPATLNYTVRVQTANGVADAAPVTLRTLRIGDVTRQDVRALVARPGAMGVSLLGQSFLSRLGSYRYENGYVILQDR